MNPASLPDFRPLRANVGADAPRGIWVVNEAFGG